MHNAIQIAERAPIYSPIHFCGPFSPWFHCSAKGELSVTVNCHITETNAHHQLILLFTSCQLGWWVPDHQPSIKEINTKLISRRYVDNAQLYLLITLGLDKEVSSPVPRGGGTVMSSGSVSLRKLMKLMLCHGEGCKICVGALLWSSATDQFLLAHRLLSTSTLILVCSLGGYR